MGELLRRTMKTRSVGMTSNTNGFIASIDEDVSCGARFDRTTGGIGIVNTPGAGPVFNRDLLISSNCHVFKSGSILGESYGTSGDGVNETALFGQKFFRVRDYEVFKIVLE
jgi:hypothetical protein